MICCIEYSKEIMEKYSKIIDEFFCYFIVILKVIHVTKLW